MVDVESGPVSSNNELDMDIDTDPLMAPPRPPSPQPLHIDPKRDYTPPLQTTTRSKRVVRPPNRLTYDENKEIIV
ncbi:hypothetical protein VNI00_018957 [Paramarasmius palmivorus]|uniref:Uncharacterized protein n=1 Tax=Paramarasmius palmivorus TaxID=297713 RepID=A0AAW0AS43_9AGAR